MTYSQADDGLSSPDMKVRLEAAEFFLKRPLEPGRRPEIIRIFNDAWEQLHAKEQAA